MKKYLNKTLFLILGLSLAATASYLNAWSGPPSGTTPPDNNVATPLNTGSSPQAKNALVSAATLRIGGLLNADSLSSFGSVSASQYCDVNGQNCSTPPFGGSSVPAGTVAAFNLATCPAGWVLADGNNGTKDLRGSFIRGYGTSTAGTAASGAFGVKQEDDFKSHSHAYSMAYNAGGIADAYARADLGLFYLNTTAYTNSTGGTETRPDNVALLFCQKDSSVQVSTSTTFAFGGTYTVTFPDIQHITCEQYNPYTNACTCPSGFTAYPSLSIWGSNPAYAGAQYHAIYQCYKS